MPKRKTLLVTGAKGTVGAYVVALAEAEGFRVIATDITARGVRVPARGEVRAADLRSDSEVARVVAGCDAVVHTAAQMSARAGVSELNDVNTEGVARLFDACRHEGVKRFVHVSTATLYKSAKSPLCEDDALAPRGPYGLSKQGAEMFLRGNQDGPDWTILRPAPIYGNRGRHFAASLLSVGPLLRLVSPILPRPSGGPRATMVHAQDVARAALFCLNEEKTVSGVFNVSDGDALDLGDRLAMTFDAYGLRSVRTGAPPMAALRFWGKLFQTSGAYQGADVSVLSAWRAVVVRHRLKSALRPSIDRELLTLLYEDLVVDGSRLRDLGFEPKFSHFDEGWAKALRWYQAERWVPRYS